MFYLYGFFIKGSRIWIYGSEIEICWRTLIWNLDVCVDYCGVIFIEKGILYVIWIILFFCFIKKEINIYFYDSKYDILFENREMNLFIEILGI